MGVGFEEISIFLKERAYGQVGILGHAAVVAFAATAFAGKHSLGTFLILLELHMFLDSEGLGHRLDIKVVGANECESPVLLLQLLNHRANHLQRPFLAAVLLAVGDDGHEYVVTIVRLSHDLRDALADGIVEGCAAAGVVGSPTEVTGLQGRRVVIVPGGVAAVEGEEGDELYLVGKLNVQYSMFNV